jgi:hypothetical protein
MHMFYTLKVFAFLYIHFLTQSIYLTKILPSVIIWVLIFPTSSVTLTFLDLLPKFSSTDIL